VLGDFPMPAVFPRLSATPGKVRWTAPNLGEHNREVWGGLLGLQESELIRLEEAGVI
jgi:formyl-CoA transferase